MSTVDLLGPAPLLVQFSERLHVTLRVARVPAFSASEGSGVREHRLPARRAEDHVAPPFAVGKLRLVEPRTERLGTLETRRLAGDSESAGCLRRCHQGRSSVGRSSGLPVYCDSILRQAGAHITSFSSTRERGGAQETVRSRCPGLRGCPVEPGRLAPRSAGGPRSRLRSSDPGCRPGGRPAASWRTP